MSFLGLFKYSWKLVGIIPTTFQQSWRTVAIAGANYILKALERS